ncbi:MAG: insulinase family protein [Desulfatitalea sp.]|nr:insulinase family protein [Desulfatitalea sp.]NNJ99748.1 insulinase family protein [Desulfatitalea sp.]
MSSAHDQKKGLARTSFLISLLLLVLFGCATQIPQALDGSRALQLRQRWPHEKSDLSPDRQTLFGQLPNGIRYILKENDTPKDRVSMHLFVQAGSLAEQAGEEGMAHFLEHMLFNGSTHFPPGDLIKFFQRIGMQFGPDANAYTGFGQTVYDILLPAGDTKSLAEGLLVLRDFAQGALLSSVEVEKEKGVVLAEMRSRDSAAYRTFKAALSFELPETIAPQRFPIGNREAVNAFTEENLRRFYHAWYGPQRLFIIMVGQFDKDVALNLIQAQFGDLKHLGEKRGLPPFGRFSHQGVKGFYHYENEMGDTSVGIETVVQSEKQTSNIGQERERLLEQLAARIVQKRLDTLLQTPDTVLTSAQIRSGDYLQQVRYAEISADCKPEHWAEALSAIEQNLRKALIYGFTDQEVDVAKRSYRADLRQAVNEENSRESQDIARNIVASLNDWQVFQSPGQRMALLGPMLDTVTAVQVYKAFRSAWSAPHRMVMVTGNADLRTAGQAPVDRILSVYDASTQKPVRPPEEKQNAVFPYLPVPNEGGAVAQRRYWEDLGIGRVVFENGFQLLFKKTTFKKNEVSAALSFGGGKSSEPRDKPGLAMITEGVVNLSGFGRMDRIELETALSDKLARIALTVQETHFQVNGEAASTDLQTLFALLRTFIKDPAVRSDALRLTVKRLENHYNTMQHSVEGQMRIFGDRFLAGNDSRFGWPSRPQMARLTPADIEQWFGTQLAGEAMDLVVVGDFEPDAMVELAARFFGTLPKRKTPGTVELTTGPAFPVSETLRLSVATDIEKALVAVAYPTDDFWDIRKTRRLGVLSNIFSERLRVDIREKLGAVYSPYAYHRAHRAYEGFGYMQAVFIIDPAQVDTIISEVHQITRNLATHGIDPDEMQRILDPILTNIKDLRQTNSYWLNSVLVGASRHPQQLDWARTLAADYSAVTAEEMKALAKTFLNNDKSALIVITPEG